MLPVKRTKSMKKEKDKEKKEKEKREKKERKEREKAEKAEKAKKAKEKKVKAADEAAPAPLDAHAEAASLDEGSKALVDSSLWELQEFEQFETLGTGTFGRVYLVRNGNTGKYFAMKVLKKTLVVRLKQVQHIYNEKEILIAVDSPFIVRMYKHFQDPRNLYFIFEYVVGGELFSHLRLAGRFSPNTARFYAAEIAIVLEYLHSKNIIYRDLKPENLLLGKDGHIKLTDFGFAKLVKDKTFTLCGTPEYLAPEVIKGKGHGKEVDWWALGVLIFEMLAGYPPFYDENPFGIYEKILLGRIAFPSHFDSAARDIIKRLLSADRTRRLGNLKDGALDVKRHKFFRNIDWDAMARKQVPAPIVPEVDHEGDTGNFEKYDEEVTEYSGPDVIDPYAHLFSEF